jgi:hypothetical protein
MIGMFSAHSAIFLRVAAVTTALLFSVPIFFAPLTWARALRWNVDAQPHLALYFGRCLGAFALVMSWTAWHVAAQPPAQAIVFRMLIGFTSLMVVVHMVGAVQNVQPWTETAEIPFWAAFAILALMFYPVP